MLKLWATGQKWKCGKNEENIEEERWAKNSKKPRSEGGRQSYKPKWEQNVWVTVKRAIHKRKRGKDGRRVVCGAQKPRVESEDNVTVRKLQYKHDKQQYVQTVMPRRMKTRIKEHYFTTTIY